MIVTDEMIELGCKAIADRCGYVWPDGFSDDEKKAGRENMRAALTAALYDQERAVEVKGLEWRYREQLVRTYCASDDRGDIYWINQAFGSDSYYFTTVRRHDGAILYDADDLEAAKAAAQADYEQRIRSALVDVPVEPVKPDWWQDEEAAEREFTEYFVRNYPGPDTIIYDPKWHAPKLFRAAKHALLATKASPPHREGEDSAEVVTLTRAEADRIAQRLEFDASWDKCGDGYYSIKRQLGTLAATRSASATSPKGGDLE